MGTATYFSPEQAQGLAVDGRSDVYSLGVVLYEIVCGVAPFIAESPVSVAYKHVREEPIPPSQRNRGHPARARADHHDRARQGPRAALPERRRPARRPAPVPARPPARRRAASPRSSRRCPPRPSRTRASPRTRSSATVASPRVPVDPNGPQGRAPQRRRHPATFTALTLLVLAAIVGGIFFASTQLGGNQVTVTVPGLIGKTQAAATQDLAEQHLFAVSKKRRERQARWHCDQTRLRRPAPTSRRTARSRSA